MSARNSVRDKINEGLHDAIAGVHEQLARVELWAAALEGFSEPVPGYEPDRKHLLPSKRG